MVSLEPWLVVSNIAIRVASLSELHFGLRLVLLIGCRVHSQTYLSEHFVAETSLIFLPVYAAMDVHAVQLACAIQTP